MICQDQNNAAAGETASHVAEENSYVKCKPSYRMPPEPLGYDACYDFDEDDSESAAHCDGVNGAEYPDSRASTGGSSPRMSVEDFLAEKCISRFTNLYSKFPDGVVSVLEILQKIKAGQYETMIKEVRLILDRDGEDDYKQAKKRLPAVSISGVINEQRKNCGNEERVEHSGLIQIDVDRKDNPDLTVQEMKNRCIQCGICAVVFISPSGRGVKALCLVGPDIENHKEYYLAAKHFFQKLGLKIDSINDVGRLMLVSHDPELWIAPALPDRLEPMPEEPDKPVPDDAPATGPIDDEVELALTFIPKRPPYDDWMRITFAVFDGVGLEKGLQLLKKWSPEEQPGEYEKLHRGDYAGPKIGVGTLFKMAADYGYIVSPIIPSGVLPVPCGGVTYTVSSRIIFRAAAKKGGYYNREGRMVEIQTDECGSTRIVEVTPERFVENVERLGMRVARREPVKDPATKKVSGYKWRTSTFPMHAAKVTLSSDQIREHLPPIRQVINAPVIVAEGEHDCKILGPGYHAECGGTYVAGLVKLDEIPVDHAVAALLLRGCLADFDFSTPSDQARAVAGIITPALRFGGILNGDVPIDVAEADFSQAGKSYFQRCVAAVYNELPSVITTRRGGVGSLDESVANALLSGSPFIAIDNCRGAIDSPLLETSIRGHGTVLARGFRSAMKVDTTAFQWQLTTNGAELTRDLANRASIVRLKKKPAGYVYGQYPEGDILQNIKARPGLYLGAVFSIITEWRRLGMPKTNEARHDFREWAQSLDWIVQHLCWCAPLLDGHREEQARHADPSMQWLRQVVLAAGKASHGRQLRASDLADIGEAAGLDYPGPSSNEKAAIRIGKIMARLFKEEASEELRVDGFSITREQRAVPSAKGVKEMWFYTISPLVG